MTNEQQSRPVSTIMGDRLCVGCAYNLRGQPVSKEAHYGLYLARCPECGTPAAVQEYPMLGRWPGRVRVFVALAYALTVLGALLMVLLLLSAMSEGLKETAAEPLAMEIATQWAEYVNTEEAAGRDPFAGRATTPSQRAADGSFMANRWYAIDTVWWRGQDRFSSFFTGFTHTIRSSVPVMALMTIPMFLMGSVLAVLILGARRSVLLVVGVIPALLMLTIFLISTTLDQRLTGWISPNEIANESMWLPAVACVFVLWLISGSAGLMLGRPIARVGVRALLPPTMRGALAELWFTDNKPLPTNTRAPRTLYPETKHRQPVKPE